MPRFFGRLRGERDGGAMRTPGRTRAANVAHHAASVGARHSAGPSGATAIVGAYQNDDNGFNSGSAYFFDTTTGLQLFKLMPDDGAFQDQFGFSVAISGATAIIGARWDNDNGDFSGSAYLFDAAAPGKCPWDLDANGTVGASDLLALLANWGPCP